MWPSYKGACYAFSLDQNKVGQSLGVLLMYTLECVSSVTTFITAYEESQETKDSHFLIRSLFFLFVCFFLKGNRFDVYYSNDTGHRKSKRHCSI